MFHELCKASESEISNETIAEVWNELSNLRFSQIENRIDISYWHVLVPVILKMAEFKLHDIVLDIGCGTGHLTNIIASQVSEIIGVDLSEKMVTLAKSHQQNTNAVIENSELATFANRDSNRSRFSVIIANMSLMDMRDLTGTLGHTYKLLKPGGRFAFTITHPNFWPIYKDFWQIPNFDYREEQAILQPFTITGHRMASHSSILFHRSLEKYISALIKTGFRIVTQEEPYPPDDVLANVSSEWRYPHFLAVSCRKEIFNASEA